MLNEIEKEKYLICPRCSCQAPLSMEFSRQEYWIAQPFPSPGDLPDPEIKPGSPTLQADSLLSESPGKPNSKDMNLSKLWEIGKDRGAWLAADHGSHRFIHDLATEQQEVSVVEHFLLVY